MKRLASLDVFRGATVAFMILVNNPGSGQAVYPPLRHASWHGWTPTDLVFPFFLWIVGVAMTLSFAKRVERGDDRKQLLLHALRRGAMIFGIGLLLNLIPAFDLPHVRIMGVLQRIGLCYMIGSAIYLYSSTRGLIGWTVALVGVYLFADYCSGRIFALDPRTDAFREPVEVGNAGSNVSSFGEDVAGELYITQLNGDVSRVVATSR